MAAGNVKMLVIMRHIKEIQALATVKKNVWMFIDVPEELKTARVCLAAVQKNGFMLKYVPKPLKTSELFLSAVQFDGNALKYIPKELRTLEICLAAVQQKGESLEYVPEALKVKGPHAFGLCLAAVQSDGNAIEYVLKSLKAKRSQILELCLVAVQNDFFCIQYIPENLQTKELISLMIEEIENKKSKLQSNNLYPLSSSYSETEEPKFKEISQLCVIKNEYEAGKFLSYISIKFRSEVKNKIIEVLGIDGVNYNFWKDYCRKLKPKYLEKRVKESRPDDFLDIDTVTFYALHYYNIAIKLFPGCSEFYAGRGHIYRYIKEEKMAQTDFDKARELGYDVDDKAKK